MCFHAYGGTSNKTLYSGRADSVLVDCMGIRQTKTRLNNMKKIKLVIFSISILAISACSSSGSDPVAGAPDLQGKWVSTCSPDFTDDVSARSELTIAGDSFFLAQVQYIGNTTCAGSVSVSRNQIASYTLTGEETELADGNAKNIDIAWMRGTATASADYLDVLSEQGTTLQAVVAASGLVTDDINNIPLDQIGITDPVEYSIYRVDNLDDGTIELRTGSTSSSFDSSTPELRPRRLSLTRRFDKVQ